MEGLEFKKSNGETVCIHYTGSKMLKNKTYLIPANNTLNAIDEVEELCRNKGRGIKKVYFTNEKKDMIMQFNSGLVKITEYKDLLSSRSFTGVRAKLKSKLEKEAFKKKFYKALEKDNKDPKIFRKPKVKRTNKITELGKKTVITGVVAATIFAIGMANSNEIKTKIEQPKETIKIVETVQQEKVDDFVIKYNDRTDTGKLEYVKKNYGTLIEKYSKRYGLDPNLVKALATQESGFHKEGVNDGGAVGLMQVQKSVWIDTTVSAYVPSENKYDSIEVTMDNLNNIEKNIQIGCAIYQNELYTANYNIAFATQAYNFGRSNMDKIMNIYLSDTGKKYSDVINDHTNNDWLEYRKYLINSKGNEIGDHEYLEHVFSYLEDENNVLNFVKKNGDNISIKINNQNEQVKSR